MVGLICRVRQGVCAWREAATQFQQEGPLCISSRLQAGNIQGHLLPVLSAEANCRRCTVVQGKDCIPEGVTLPSCGGNRIAWKGRTAVTRPAA